MNRQEANLKLLEIIRQYILSYPDLRFTQLLSFLKINVENDLDCLTDLFHEESVKTLERVITAISSISNSTSFQKEN